MFPAPPYFDSVLTPAPDRIAELTALALRAWVFDGARLERKVVWSAVVLLWNMVTMNFYGGVEAVASRLSESMKSIWLRNNVRGFWKELFDSRNVTKREK